MQNLTLYLSFFLLFIGCTDKRNYDTPTADLILYNGNIITVDQELPRATALAISGTQILAVGNDSDLLALAGNQTKQIDLHQQTVIPGLIESHAHFMDIGYTKMKLDLTGAETWDAIVAIVAEAVKNADPGEWILGRGWHQEKWIEPLSEQIEGYPVHHKLSVISPLNPVYLTHASGHAVIANKLAMESAGIDIATSDPEGGRLLRFADGTPSGVFLENAEDLIINSYEADFAAKSRGEQRNFEEKAFNLAVQTCLDNGIVSLHDAGASFENVDFYKEMLAAGRMPIRLYVMLGASNKQLAAKMASYRMIGAGRNHLTVRAIKRFIDGALGAHGAWLLEPYTDLPASRGMNTIDLPDLKETARLAEENGYQLCTHAIGDLGIRETLGIYEAYMKNKDLRWRIEHAQHIDPEDVSRFASAGIIAAMQTNHATSDGPWVIKRLGERRSREGAYAWRKLLDTGAIICNGTDAPVESIDPMANFYAAVTRRMANGQEFFPEQAMTREEALKSYTISGAYAAFEESIKGTITAGKLADLTVLSDDLLTVPVSDIPTIRVTATMIDGQFAYRSSGVFE